MNALGFLTNEIEIKFALQGKGQEFVSHILGIITNKKTGGVMGFLNLFKEAGLEKLASGWLSGSSTPLLSVYDLEKSVGPDTINRIASKLEVSTGSTGAALAYLIPKLVRLLTNNGKIADPLPDWLPAYLSDNPIEIQRLPLAFQAPQSEHQEFWTLPLSELPMAIRRYLRRDTI